MKLKIFNNRILYLIPAIFFIFTVVKVWVDYDFSTQREYDFAKKEAQVLSAYAVVHRNYYQELFIDGVIPLTQKSVVALPAYSSSYIAKDFSKDNKFDITIRTVSDRARNPKNTANDEEKRAIEYFRTHKNSKEYFKENSDFYQYASVLRVSKKCLICHGAKKDAPKYIRDKYDKAYGYKLGEVRGILSILIPRKTIKNYFFPTLFEAISYDVVLLILLFVGIFYLARKSSSINKLLEQKIKEKTLQLSSTYMIDKLTDLPSRNQLIEDITASKDLMAQHLSFINIDNFKDVNDFYGYDVGDKLLKRLGDLLKVNCDCENGNVYKLPSDEYALFSNDKMTKDEFVFIASKIIDIVSKTQFDIDGNKILISLSCGIASGVENIMRKADMALRMAKKENKNIVIYSDNLDFSNKIQKHTKVTSLLRYAIENDTIVPFFQPIYNIKTKKIEKYECLVRIVKEDGGIVLPYEFLDVAMKSKIYSNITRSMIRKAFEFFKDTEYEFSINISILDILNVDTVDFIVEKLSNFKNPKRVIFEILEYDEIKNFEIVKRFLETMREFGCKLALDDFGSGYSNFSYVYELNPDFIKIDASLIKHITTDCKSKIITKAIIDFAKALKIQTIAEYVEDKESLELLQEIGIDFIQGYYIGKPQDKLL